MGLIVMIGWLFTTIIACVDSIFVKKEKFDVIICRELYVIRIIVRLYFLVYVFGAYETFEDIADILDLVWRLSLARIVAIIIVQETIGRVYNSIRNNFY